MVKKKIIISLKLMILASRYRGDVDDIPAASMLLNTSKADGDTVVLRDIDKAAARIHARP